jgi:hypothetical protein
VQALKHGDAIINEQGAPVALELVQRHFGMTSRPTYTPARGTFTLQYPGLSIIFPVTDQQQQFFDEACGFDPTSTRTFPDGTAPRMAELRVHHYQQQQQQQLQHPVVSGDGGDGASAYPALRPQATAQRQFYGEAVAVVPGQGLAFASRARSMGFGHTPQDIMSGFGR